LKRFVCNYRIIFLSDAVKDFPLPDFTIVPRGPIKFHCTLCHKTKTKKNERRHVEYDHPAMPHILRRCGCKRFVEITDKDHYKACLKHFCGKEFKVNILSTFLHFIFDMISNLFMIVFFIECRRVAAAPKTLFYVLLP